MSKGQATKTSILDEAVQVASTAGFEALTIGRLAERAEMSKSGLFAHFRSKEQLQLQALDHAAAWFTDLVVRPALKAPRGEPRLRELFERWLAWETETLPGGCVFITGATGWLVGPEMDGSNLQQHPGGQFGHQLLVREVRHDRPP